MTVWKVESAVFFLNLSRFTVVLSFPPQERHQFLAQETNQPKKGYQQRHRRWEIPMYRFC